MTDRQQELIDKIYKFGFEVGYKNHLEVGWVLRVYDSLIKEALNLGIKSPESYYSEGKKKGKAGREQGIEGQKVPEKVIDKVGVSIFYSEDKLNDETEAYHPLEKPRLNDLPRMVEKISATDLPEFLEGLKLLRRK